MYCSLFMICQLLVLIYYLRSTEQLHFMKRRCLPFGRFESRYKGKTTKRRHICYTRGVLREVNTAHRELALFPAHPPGGESITPQRRTHSQRRRSLPPRRRCIVNPAKWALGHFYKWKRGKYNNEAGKTYNINTEPFL